MKFTYTLIILLCSFLTQAQTTNKAIAPTSIEEYNYLTKGYKVQMESGLDMKKGYSLKAINSYKIGNRTFEYKGLFRDGENKPCAVLVIYTYSLTSTTQVLYLCIPSNDASEDMWKTTYATFAPISDDGQNAFIFALMKLSMFQIGR